MRWLPWALVAAAVGAGAYIAWRLDDDRASEAEAARNAEQALAREKGIVAAQITTIQQLGDRLAAAEARVPGLEAEVERITRAFHDAKLTRVVSASTGPVPSATPAPADGSRLCLYYAGDQGRIDVGTAEYQTDAGTALVAGAAAAYGLDPERLLFSGPYKAPLTGLAVAPPPPPGLSRLECAAWGVGAALAGALAGEVDARLRR